MMQSCGQGHREAQSPGWEKEEKKKKMLKIEFLRLEVISVWGSGNIIDMLEGNLHLVPFISCSSLHLSSHNLQQF